MASTAIKAVIGDPKNLVRFSYLHVFEPYAFNETDAKKYSATILIPKNSPLVDSIRKAITKAYEAAVTEKWGGKKPPMAKATCLQDGDEPKDDGEDRGEAYHGHYFINAKTTSQPGVVNTSRQPILNSEEMYSGCYGIVSVSFSGYFNNGNMGVSCFLNNIMKVKDGDPLGSGATTAEQDFEGLDFGDDDL